MAGRLAGGRHRGVRREELGPVAPQPERLAHQQQLGVAGALLGDQPGPLLEVDRPAVVGVDQAVLAQLRALVDVGDAGHRQAEQLGRERVAPAGVADGEQHLVEHATHPLVVEGGVDRGVDGAFVRRVGGGPGGAVTRLAHRLLGVRVEAVAQCRVFGLARRGQDTHHRLPQQVREAGIGQRGELQQPVERWFPDVGDLGQHADPGAYVLGPLGVVGRGGGHGVRPLGLPGGHRRMELPGVDREDRRVAADLVERGQPGPAVEGAVLDALGHHHAAGLLEALGRAGGAVAEDGCDRVEGPGQVGPVVARQGERLVEVVAALGQVGAVDREAGEQLGDGVDEDVLLGRVLQQRAELAGDPAGLGQQGGLGDGALGAVDHRRPVDGGAAQPVLERAERLLAGGVGQHPVDQGQCVVAGRAGGGPRVRQLLAGLEDLLDEDVRPTGQLGEVVEVLHRVAQAVRVVDPQPVDQLVLEPARDLLVGAGEPLRVLDPDRGQGVDREEAPVVELAVAAAPVDQLVVLSGVDGVGVVRRLRVGRPGSQREALVVVVKLTGEHPEMADRPVVVEVVVADDRDQQAAASRLPVDVEGGGVRRLLAVGEDVPPPRVLPRPGDADVVGHDVDEHAHAEPPRLARQRRQPGAPAPARVDRGVVGHVVAVVAAGRGRQDRREVDPVDAQVVEVGQRPSGVEEVELLGDLEPVGARGDTHAFILPNPLTGQFVSLPTR